MPPILGACPVPFQSGTPPLQNVIFLPFPVLQSKNKDQNRVRACFFLSNAPNRVPLRPLVSELLSFKVKRHNFLYSCQVGKCGRLLLYPVWVAIHVGM